MRISVLDASGCSHASAICIRIKARFGLFARLWISQLPLKNWCYHEPVVETSAASVFARPSIIGNQPYVLCFP